MRERLRGAAAVVGAAWATKSWLHWAAAYSILLSYFFFYRLHTVSSILNVFAAEDQQTARVKASGMVLGLLEDWAITTLLLLVLLLLELVACTAVARIVQKPSATSTTVLRVLTPVTRFTVSFVLTALVLAPFAADLLLIRTREMRFTMDFITMYIREKAEASSLQVDVREVRIAKATIAATVVIALLFAVSYTAWLDLTLWLAKPNDRGQVVHAELGVYKAGVQGSAPDFGDSGSVDSKTNSENSDTAQPRGSRDKLAEQHTIAVIADVDPDFTIAAVVKPHTPAKATTAWFHRGRGHVAAAFVVSFVVEVVITCAIAHAVSPPVASVALNMTLNELFRGIFGVRFEPTAVKTGGEWSACQYIHSETEEFRLLKDDVLYRKTTGFKGALAFDIAVDPANPPNVLVLVVESMRYSDSLYTAGETTGGATLKRLNFSVTPNYDRWAKRGVAFSNMWSSWQTSRSVESINFAQIPYDSVTMTGTTGGRQDTKLVGMPQLFKQKGYETVFTTGCTVRYDQWDTFLPSHGYETVLGEPDIQALGMKDLHLTVDEWNAGRRSLNWGVHDDVSFQVLGNLMMNKSQEQRARVAKGEAKKPFLLNHYTISSHMPFEMRPKWYDAYPIPDFSPLYLGKEYANGIKNYNEMRFFTDLELGKFLDRMEAEGILNDTIVVICGDHGISPEYGMAQMCVDQATVTRVPAAIIAEGRLGAYAGLLINDTVEHYDLLNTLADITGVPSGGFMQTGVGRSLKRKITEGTRPVWSNNPLKKKSVVRGSLRFVYDSISDAVALHDVNADPFATVDLFPTLSAEQQAEWLVLRDSGRTLNEYFKHRWDNKCLTQAAC